MLTPDKIIQDIVEKALTHSASDQELQQLEQWLMHDPSFEKTEWLNTYLELQPIATGNNENERWNTIIQNIVNVDKHTQIYHIKSRKKNWIPYAAAAVLLIIAGTYFWMSPKKEKPSVTQTNPVPVQNDVAPGGNRATLTLADGSTIVLDSAANGKLADEDKSLIEKRDNQIVYLLKNKKDIPDQNKLLYNTMSTPRGGQYQLILPDQTKVWLNAESSITYPTAFTEKERKVSITGEAYFEVTKDKKKPFIVQIQKNKKEFPSLREGPGVGSENEQGSKNDLEIEVLGTEFNINSYENETSTNTTLIEGSVKIKSVHTSLILKPGQQGQLTDRGLTLASNPNIEQAVAWKNGYFNFEGADLKTVMRQLARWYDVEVVYETDPGQREFGGEIQRNLNLSDLLEGLQKTDIHFRIQGKKLIITR